MKYILPSIVVVLCLGSSVAAPNWSVAQTINHATTETATSGSSTIGDITTAPIRESLCSDSYFTDCGTTASGGLFKELYFRLAIDGSKQPQEFGVNAHLGGQASVNWGLPILPAHGIGLQMGSGVTATGNAVRVYELLNESTGRTQNFTTVGMFQRRPSGFAWGFVHDFVYEDYFDEFQLGQWRLRASYDVTCNSQIGVTAMLQSYGDDGVFGEETDVRLKPIDQFHIYWRRFWDTGAQTTFWTGFAEGHSEDNAVTGFSPGKDESFLFGADVLMPLTDRLAIYGETNLMMPADTGTVDAFLGIQWYPCGCAKTARRGQYSPLFELASPVSFSTDLSRR